MQGGAAQAGPYLFGSLVVGFAVAAVPNINRGEEKLSWTALGVGSAIAGFGAFVGVALATSDDEVSITTAQ